ncbi:insulinase family protein [Candidatus Roizmanbacteria bacterium]|nr:insulinase family protein [Candidatus Roizmanbacteria bacterium]
MEPQVYTLKNGLTVILVDTKAFPTLTTLLLVGAGSRYETTENNGIAHFFEHMAFKGSHKYPNSLLISSIIEGLGGVFNAFTSKDSTGYWIKATTDHFETVLDVLSDMIIHPLLLEDEIEREKGVIVEEINLYEDTPYRKVGELYEELLYKGNPLGYEITGTKDSVRSFTRITFTDYISQLYHPQNAVLVVAGGFQHSKLFDPQFHRILALVEEKFGRWKPNGGTPEFQRVTEHQDKPQIQVVYKKTEQAHFCLGFRAFSFFDERKYALSVLTAILGGGMSSRLFTEVREKRGLCYYISTGRELYHDVGNLVTQAGVTNNVEKIKESIRVILAEHKKIVHGDVRKEELENAKELLKGRLLLSMEDSHQIASFLGSRKILQNQVTTPAQTVERIRAVTFEDVFSLAQEILRPKNLNFVMVGPVEKESEIEEAFREF